MGYKKRAKEKVYCLRERSLFMSGGGVVNQRGGVGGGQKFRDLLSWGGGATFFLAYFFVGDFFNALFLLTFFHEGDITSLYK